MADKKKRAGPGEVLMWFSIALIIVGVVLWMGSYLGDFSITTMSLIMVGVGVGIAVLAKMIMK
jgi:hypothetical protein